MSNLILPKKPSFLIKKNFLNEAQLSYAWQEIKKRKNDYSRDGYSNKKTIRDNFDPRFCGTQIIKDQRSILYSLWSKFFWEQMGETLWDHEDSAFIHASHMDGGTVLLSCYGNNDYYGYHIDIDLNCIVTAVLFLNFGKPFKGGDFVLRDELIPFEHNKLLLFPSCIPHAVTKIETDSTDYQDMRFSLQYFISAVPFKKTLIDESSNIE